MRSFAPRVRRWPTLRQVWSQLHWLIGITAGSVLFVIGLSGATLAFREELLDLLNPGVRTVPVRQAARLAPDQVLQAVRAAHPDGRVAALTLYAAPDAAVRATLAPKPGERRGETLHVDPYTGAMLGTLRGDAVFDWVESLHRWLLLPRESGRAVAGTLALCLLGLAFSGLYLRWPRRLGDWRAWFTVNTRLRGRPFLWSLHAVAGTWALPAYLIFASSGAYWSFDVIRDTVDGWADARRAPRAAEAPGSAKSRAARKGAAAPAVALAPAWNAFVERAPGWDTASVRLPEKAGQPIQLTWLAADAPHPRARNRMSIGADGKVLKDEPYAAMSAGQRALSTIYPLHMGTYFGLPGRIAMMLASLSLPGFAVTGWMLYLRRRREAAAATRERVLLAQAGPIGARLPDGPGQGAPTLLAYATQGGQAERIALHTAGALRRAGTDVRVQSMAELAAGDLDGYRRALFVVSTFGEGEPPDTARRFARELEGASAALSHLPLSHLRYAILALGDRNYASFCGFGHAVNRRLDALGADAMFPLVEVDAGDESALARWTQALGLAHEQERDRLAGAIAGNGDDGPFGDWPLCARARLNPGSLGSPLYEVTLAPGAGQDWRAGDLVEIEACHAPTRVVSFLAASGLDGATMVEWRGARRALADVLACCDLPDPGHPFASAQDCADALKPTTPRRYSIASIPADGRIELLVRQQRHEQGLGLASGWLTAHAQPGSAVRARLLANPSFHGPADDVPCIFIGNGSGMAGLRAHLRERVRAGRRRNWLLFGERQARYDSLCAREIAAWRQQGMLPELDLVFSRDPSGGYVQDRLRARADTLRAWVADGAAIYVCGSLQGMAAGVDAALAEILGAEQRDALMAGGRYRRDVY